MAGKVKVDMRLEGVKELEQNLKRISREVQQNLMTYALVAGAEVVREGAKRLAPVGETGALAEGFRTEVDTGEEKGTVKMGPRIKTFYGYFLELGTSKMSPKPFMRPAVESKSQEALEAIAATLKRGLEMLAR